MLQANNPEYLPTVSMISGWLIGMNGRALGINLEFRFLPGGGPPNSFSRSSNNFILGVPFGNGDVGLALCLTNINCVEQHDCSFKMLTGETAGRIFP